MALDALRAPGCGYIPDLSRIIVRLRAMREIDEYWPDSLDEDDSWSELNPEEVERARSVNVLPARVALHTAMDFAGLPKLLPSLLLLKASTLDWRLPGENAEHTGLRALAWSLGAAMYPFGYNRLAKLLECSEDDIGAAVSRGLVGLWELAPSERDIDLLFGARVRSVVAETKSKGDSLPDEPFPGSNRLLKCHIAELLHEIMWLEEHRPETSLALGLYLAATGELDEAKVLLELATTGLPDSPFARYLYVDCCRSLGTTPAHDMIPFLPFGDRLDEALLDEATFTSGRQVAFTGSSCSPA